MAPWFARLIALWHENAALGGVQMRWLETPEQLGCVRDGRDPGHFVVVLLNFAATSQHVTFPSTGACPAQALDLLTAEQLDDADVDLPAHGVRILRAR